MKNFRKRESISLQEKEGEKKGGWHCYFNEKGKGVRMRKDEEEK